MADVTAEFRSAGFPNTHQEIYCLTSLFVAYQYYMTCKVLVTTFCWYLLIELCYCLTYLLTAWSRVANRFSASREIPRILWNPKVITAFTSARHLSLS